MRLVFAEKPRILSVMIDFRKRYKAFCFAFRGIGQAFLLGQNMKIHGLACIWVFYWMLVISFQEIERLVLLLCCMMVFFGEIINTALEQLCDGIRWNVGIGLEM